MKHGNLQRRRARAPAGFTLLELVVILLLVGTLAVVAAVHLSRTHDAAVAAHIRSLAGNLQSAVSQFHANWKLAEQPEVNVPGWGDETLDANRFGYPAGGRRDGKRIASDRDCEDVWRGLLMDGPAVVEADPDAALGTTFAHIEPKLGTGVTFVAGQSATIADATVALPPPPHDEICQFISLHYQRVTPGAPKPTIFYDSRTGAVFTDLDRTF